MTKVIKNLQKKAKIKRRMNSIKNEIASDMYYNEKSPEIGIFAGQAGGVVVKKLTAEKDEKLTEQDEKK